MNSAWSDIVLRLKGNVLRLKDDGYDVPHHGQYVQVGIRLVDDADIARGGHGLSPQPFIHGLPGYTDGVGEIKLGDVVLAHVCVKCIHHRSFDV